jgi:hypothetical protein
MVGRLLVIMEKTNKLIALFRWVDIDEAKGAFDTTYAEIVDILNEWNIDMQTEYETIQQFNDNEEYYSIELKLIQKQKL